jgi:hypothetical protein
MRALRPVQFENRKLKTIAFSIDGPKNQPICDLAVFGALYSLRTSYIFYTRALSGVRTTSSWID